MENCRMFGNITTMPHINSETNPPFPIINVICKYLRQFPGTSFCHRHKKRKHRLETRTKPVVFSL